MSRWAWAEVDPTAITHNVALLYKRVAPSQLWAVVKADGYGHGGVLAARAALAGGATGLCVALVDEGIALRTAGIDAPVLVLSEQPPDDLAAAVRHGLQLTVYSLGQLESIASTDASHHPVHLKIDTGMHRVGARPSEAVRLADAIASCPATRLEGVFTHLALADEPADPFTNGQLDAFDATLATLRAAGHAPVLVHAANSAGALAHPRARYDMVRSGIAIYGLSPGAGVELPDSSRAAMSVRARVSHVKRVRSGERIGYGLRHRFERDTSVATLPIGYADGVPRRAFSAGVHVIVGGALRPIVGTVTMDQIMVDCGDDAVVVGDAAVLIGSIGECSITADDWARQLDTIGYEIVCGISERVERR